MKISIASAMTICYHACGCWPTSDLFKKEYCF